MAKKNNEVKENEELKENVVTEATQEVVEEVKEAEKVVEEAKVEENASNTEEDAKVQVTENILVANTAFNDKYTATKYEKGTEFEVVDEEIETEKVSDKKYRISAKRAEEIKAKGYAD